LAMDHRPVCLGSSEDDIKNIYGYAVIYNHLICPHLKFGRS
jgi:hypothetical protein